MPDPVSLPQWLTDLPKHLAWRIADRVQRWEPGLDADDEFIALADLRAAWQAQEGRHDAPACCPHCKTGTNDPTQGGNDHCFHCGTCSYIGCMWTKGEKREMLASIAEGRA